MSQFVRDAIDEKLRGSGILTLPKEVRAPDRMSIADRFSFGPTRGGGEILNEEVSAPPAVVKIVSEEVARSKKRKARA